MPDSTPKDSNEEPTKDSLDLSDLKSFSFGTQWTAASKSSSDSGKPRFDRGGNRGGDRPNRRPGSSGPPRKDRRPPRPNRTEGESAPRTRSEQGGQGEAGGRPFRRGARHDSGRAPFQPYESQVFDICFYPDDNCFSAIIKAMRGNHLTYELFHVAKLFMEKSDRFIASVTRKAAEGQKPDKVYICVLDNMPFASEEEVIAHTMAHHSDTFFTKEEIEVEAPTGNFPFVNRCPITKVLLGPPNYHKYEATLRNHHMTRLPNMAFEKLQGMIETVREEEVVNEWLESQKKATRYTAKEVEEGAEPKTFLSVEAAMTHLRGDVKAKVVKQVNYARVSGSVLEKFKDSEAFKAMDGERQRQQRFPLDTANAIRGRMRREKFSIYKKGAKGVTYVCSTKRNFRTPGQVMSPDLDRIIRFLEANQNLKAKELPEKYAAWIKAEGIEDAVDEKKVLRDLHWLIADGYVSHFEDDSLFAQPVLESGAKSEDGGSKSKSKGKAAAEAKKSAAAAEAQPEAAAVEASPAAEATETAETTEVAAAEETPAAVAEEESQPDDAVETTVTEAAEAEKVEAVEAAAPAVEKIEAVEEVEAEAPAAVDETVDAASEEASPAEEKPAEAPVVEVEPVAEKPEPTPEAGTEPEDSEKA